MYYLKIFCCVTFKLFELRCPFCRREPKLILWEEHFHSICHVWNICQKVSNIIDEASQLSFEIEYKLIIQVIEKLSSVIFSSIAVSFKSSSRQKVVFS